nr:unnamed protein product [Haemonchus contortus]
MQGSYIGMMNPKNTASLPPSYGKPFPTLSPYLTDIPAASSELAEIVEKNHWYTQLSPTIATALTPYFTEFTTITPEFRGTTADDEQSIEFKQENHWYTRLSSAIATALTPSFADITTTTPEFSDITVDNTESVESRGKKSNVENYRDSPCRFPTKITKIRVADS